MAFDITRLKEIPVVDILRDIYGIEVRKNGERYYCKIRSERIGSCCIYPTNTWYDFGSGAGGDTIALIVEMESCDRKDAIKKLADWYNISPEKRTREGNILWEYEWKKLGIEPDMVSKNLNINIIASEHDRPNSNADINLYLENSAQLTAFYEKYYVSMNEFRASDKVGYHNFLKRHTLAELFNEKDDYYGNLLSDYNISCEIGGEKFAFEAVSNSPAHKAEADRISEKSQLLRRAVDDISLLKVPLLSLSPEKDLQEILSGKTAVKISKRSYFELCRIAKIQHEKIYIFEISRADYVSEHDKKQSKTHLLPHTCYYKDGSCKVSVFGKNIADFSEIFGEKIVGDFQKSSDFRNIKNEKSTHKSSLKSEPKF